MFSINVIVVPIDFSDHSLVALDYAVGLADSYRSQVKVVFVNEPGLKISDMGWVGFEEGSMDERQLAEARREIEKTVLERVSLDVPVDAHILYGDPVGSIIDFAADVNADLLVMATHGRTGLSHVLLGSVAEQVVRRAPCPVLTLKRTST